MNRKIQKSGGNKKYRTDVLIKEQFESLSQLEAKLKENVELLLKYPKLDELLEARGNDLGKAVTLLTHIEDEQIDEDLDKDNSYDEWLKSYRINLIRCDLVKKLETELSYARTYLARAIKKQTDLKKARDRVDWLENEIERIIQANKDVEFPLKRSLNLDENLKIEKKCVYDDLNIPRFIEDGEETKAAKEAETLNQLAKAKAEEVQASEREVAVKKAPEYELIQLEFKWEKKSTGSTNSLFEDSDDEEESGGEKSRKSSAESTGKKEPSDEIEEKTEIEVTAEEKEETEEEENDVDKTLVINESNVENQLLNEELIEEERQSESVIDNEVIEAEKDKDKPEIGKDLLLPKNRSSISFSQTSPSKTPKLDVEVENEQTTAAKYPVWQKIHARYEMPAYSRKLVSLYPSSYHRLGLATVESQIDTEGLVDGKLEPISRKKSIDFNDAEFLNLAKVIQNVSKKVCSESHQFTESKRPQSINRYGHIIDINELESRSTLSHSAFKKKKLAVYPAPSLLPPTPLSLTRTNKSESFPRAASAFVPTDRAKVTASLDNYKPRFTANQQNLKEETKLILYHSPKKPQTVPNEYDYGYKKEEETKTKTSRIPPIVSWNEIKPDMSPAYHSGLKFERIKGLLTVNLNSKCFEEKRDAIRHLGLLKLADNSVVYALNKFVNDENENEIIRFESAKSLVILGDWSENVCKILATNLLKGNRFIQNDILSSIINSKNPQFTDLSSESMKQLIQSLEKLIESNPSEEKIILEASICVGKIGVKRPRRIVQLAQNVLLRIAESSSDWTHRSLALQALVKLFMEKQQQETSTFLLRLVIEQVERAPDWTARCAAARLLSHLGATRVAQSGQADTVFHLLDERLSQDPIREVRLSIGRAIIDLNLYSKIFTKISKNLVNPDENVRAKAVISIEMLGVGKKRTIDRLIDMLELDSSEYVRTVTLKALIYFAPNNHKVTQALNGIEKNSKIYQIMNRIKEQTGVYF